MTALQLFEGSGQVGLLLIWREGRERKGTGSGITPTGRPGRQAQARAGFDASLRHLKFPIRSYNFGPMLLRLLHRGQILHEEDAPFRMAKDATNCVSILVFVELALGRSPAWASFRSAVVSQRGFKFSRRFFR